MKINKITTISVLLSLLLGGCATFYRPTNPAWITCEGTRCDKIWQRAQTWLATNSRYRIQIANDVIIQTYGPFDNVFDGVAYTITKTNQDNGKTRIEIHGACPATIYGCTFDPSPYTNKLFVELDAIK